MRTENEKITESELNDLNPVYYAMAQELDRKSTNENYRVIKPELRDILIADANGGRMQKGAAIGDYIALVAHPEGITVTHTDTGMAFCWLDTRFFKSFLQLLSVLVPGIEDEKKLKTKDPKIPATSKKLKRFASLLNRINKAWGNSEIEEIAGCFWKDRQFIENELVDFGLPRKLAEQFAFANRFEN